MTGGPPEGTGPLGGQVGFIVRAVEVQRPLTFLGTSQCWRAGEGLPMGWAQGGDSGDGGRSILKRESTAVAGGSGSESVTKARILWSPKGTVMALWRGTKFGSRGH